MMQAQFLIDFIQSSGGATSEYRLLQFVDKTCPEFFATLGDNPSLFKKHFYLFYHLYLLTNNLSESSQFLKISSIEIKICQYDDTTRFDLAETDGLKEFYSNIDNLNLSDQEVNEMLDQFWQKYLAIDKKTQAILLLGLENIKNLDILMIKNRFNQLAHKYHPDKGGKEDYFFELKQAYNILRRLY